MSRDGMHFKKDELPMDHPNGMCTMEPNVANDMIDQLANWFNSPDGTYPEIDEFAGNFGYQASKTGTVQDFISKYGTSTKSPNAWFNSLTPVQKAEAKLLKEQSGLTWNDWYKQNVYAGDGSNLGGAKTKVVQAFSDAQNKYLSPYGFTPDNMPKTFDDWSYKISHSQATEILKSMGTDWGDPHPYQQLMKYYNANLTSANLTTQTVKATKTVTKVGKSADTTFDAVKWYESVKKNDLQEMEKWTNDWLGSITSTEKKGVNIYTSNAYDDMNRYLRGKSNSTSYSKEIEAAKKALSKAKLPQDTIVRRGSDYNMLRELNLGTITPQNKDTVIGAIVQDKGFVSTSPDSRGGFSGDIEYIIKVPQGSQAMYVAPISRYSSENELLINCGGKYSVEDVEFDSYGDVKKIYMTLRNLQ